MQGTAHWLARLCLVLALVSATGGQIVVLQSLAWTQMLVTAVQHEGVSVPAALARTFDGQHPCALCRQVEQHLAGSAATKAATPVIASSCTGQDVLLFFALPTAIFLPPATVHGRALTASVALSSRTDAPRLRPPRA
ncbi:MAG: hypothetical protein JO295_00630 [Verrucomicrobia bacterium]|nr:hypothetical protein [Verrucomicrobiota bacterium]